MPLVASAERNFLCLVVSFAALGDLPLRRHICLHTPRSGFPQRIFAWRLTISVSLLLPTLSWKLPSYLYSVSLRQKIFSEIAIRRVASLCEDCSGTGLFRPRLLHAAGRGLLHGWIVIHCAPVTSYRG